MTDERFIVPIKKYKESSTVISMRVPRDMLRDVDKAAERSGRTRNEVLVLALEFALEHMEFTEE